MQFDNHGGDLLSDLWQIKSESRYQSSQNFNNGNYNNVGQIPTTYRSNSVGSNGNLTLGNNLNNGGNGSYDIWSNDLTKIPSNNSTDANFLNYNYQSTTYSPTYSPNYSPISLSSTNLSSLPNLSTEKNEETASNASDDKKPINTQLYKTELCGSFIKTNYCPYGNKCQFAHGENELKFVKRPNNYRSKDCVNWKNFGTCRYGNRCCFKHD
ncbi:hypothetical protein CLIB1444_15S02058 [[Candida] jaroonii]|uniref:Uncharacterized protein n=1 Tax=[Candida] jaroonii TaxID=467808 RepID=A0ACA9YEM0_9ASCO|nr:hypothetical protein CLIB1444_15S02058 [[Candida] jaroonii]